MSRNTDGRRPVTPEMRQTLRNWQDRTGFGLKSLFRYAQIHKLFTPTKSLTAAAFQGVLTGKTRTVFLKDYVKIIAAYQSIPEKAWHKQHALSRQKERIPVTDGFKTRLQAFFDAHSMSRAKLLKYNGAPTDLTSPKIGLILKRENTTIMKSHAEFLERLMSAHEDG